MSTSRRKASIRAGLRVEFPTLAFLSIMLGLMSVMALTVMGIATQKRQEARRKQTVELVGVPSSFRPFHVRCSLDRVRWLDADGTWQSVQLFSLLAFLRLGTDSPFLPSDCLRFTNFLREKTLENRRLSFTGQQNTLILWVEPDGSDSAIIVQYLVSDRLGLPIRIGKLPIRPNEEITAHHGALAQ